MTRRGWLKQVVAMVTLTLLGAPKLPQRSLRADKPLRYPGRVNEMINVTGPSQWGG